jgi:hypothetical protein
MIKLTDLLLEVKLTPKEQEDYNKALAILKDKTLDEGIMDKLKKLGLSATVIAALMASPQLSQAQKSAVSDLKDQTTMTASTIKTNPTFWVNDTNDIKNVQKVIKAYRLYSIANWKAGKEEIEMSGTKMDPKNPEHIKRVEKNYMLWCLGTSEDGKNGQYTSQFEFPKAFLKDLNSGKISDLGVEGNSLLKSSGLTATQMAEWNNFVKWMKSKGFSGKSDMDRANFRDNVLQQYKGQVKEHKMTKQELREAIRRVIKQELLNEALFLPPTQVAYFDGYDDAKKGKPADVNYYRKDMELDKEKTVPNPNASKWRIVGLDTGNVYPNQGAFYDSKEEAQAAFRKLGRIKDSGVEYVQLKDTIKMSEAAPAETKPKPGVKEPPSKKPNRQNPGGDTDKIPKKIPAKATTKATMKEVEMLKQVINRFKRFKSKKNA